MEMIIFDKFLVRSDELQYILSTKIKGKKAVVKVGDDGKKDYSNFDTRNSTYHNTVFGLLKSIREAHIRESNVKDLDELFDLLAETNYLLKSIKEKLETI